MNQSQTCSALCDTRHIFWLHTIIQLKRTLSVCDISRKDAYSTKRINGCIDFLDNKEVNMSLSSSSDFMRVSRSRTRIILFRSEVLLINSWWEHV